ncbi:MAG: GNAT family N-acetyltransferase [Phycisphaerae bacterium]|nr:GNAT family N-acetyltransferase [Phycisphaerae bacterium]
MHTATYGPATEADYPALGRLIALAFASPLDGAVAWISNQGPAGLRVMRDPAGSPVACLRRIDMGQYFGGVSVPMTGIAGVAVAPEARGRGLALDMMRRCLRDAADAGEALSCLYASTQTLYRQVGYEQAGHRWTIRIAMAHLDIRCRARSVTHLPPKETVQVRDCYGAFARRFDGMLDRPAYIWDRIAAWRDKHYDGWALTDAGRVAAYCFMRQVAKETGRQTLELSDLAFDSHGSMLALLGFLADFASMADEIVFHAGPIHPVLMAVSQQRYNVTLKEPWLLRIVRPDVALARRGYRPGLDTEFAIDLADDTIPGNSGRYRVRIRDGRAEVERSAAGAGGPALRCGPRGLAALFTGYLSPEALSLCGLVEGDTAALARAGAAFAAGSPPWMTDFF